MLDLSTLNPQQLAAVKHTEGALLVLAGAGSGKTGVITYRIAHLLLNKKVPPAHILAVTFTNKAAKEMRERVDSLVGRPACKGIIISTFHSLGVRILRRDIERLGYKKNFSIYSTSDQIGLVKQIMREVNIDGKKYDADTIIWKISAAKNKLIPPDRFTPRYGDEYEMLAALHKADIIHGDYTPANLILESGGRRMFVIDFGLGFISNDIEDKAVDVFTMMRAIVMCVALVGMVGIAFELGGSLASRVGWTTVPQIQGPYAPNASVADLLAAAQ